MNLLGRSIADAEDILKNACIDYMVFNYLGPKPYQNADDIRVVRVIECEDNLLNLTVCAFKSAPELEGK